MLDRLHAIELHCDCIAAAWEIRTADGEIGDTEENLPPRLRKK